MVGGGEDNFIYGQKQVNRDLVQIEELHNNNTINLSIIPDHTGNRMQSLLLFVTTEYEIRVPDQEEITKFCYYFFIHSQRVSKSILHKKWKSDRVAKHPADLSTQQTNLLESHELRKKKQQYVCMTILVISYLIPLRETIVDVRQTKPVLKYIWKQYIRT